MNGNRARGLAVARALTGGGAGASSAAIKANASGIHSIGTRIADGGREVHRPGVPLESDTLGSDQ